MPQQDFVHLHVHTQYSLLDGANRIEPLIARAKTFNMPAIAMTDHGNMFGAIEFYQKAKAAGIKPIIGCEAYFAPGSRLDREAQGAGAEDDYSDEGRGNPYYHLILLAADMTGYKNLMRLLTIAHTEGFYYKPRIDREVLAKHAAGLIGLSGCLRGEIPYLLGRGKEQEALVAAGEYQEIFGKGHFYVEMQDNGLEAQVAVNRQLVTLAQKTDVPLVATNDCHYLHPEDSHAHDVMLCLQTGKTLNMPNRMRFKTDQLYLKSSEEMVRAFAELPSAISNTVGIAERIHLELNFKAFHLPHYKVPDGETREGYLTRLSYQGFDRRLESPSLAAKRSIYEERLKTELEIINKMGYAGYFLIVWDIIKFARSSQIPVGPGRGSSAGSLVAYVLGITDMDPIVHGLIFERFLNPERITLPDIDMDFCMDRRDEVIRYVTQKFGNDHVCQIITFGTMAAKAAIRDVGRVLEIPYPEVDKLAKLIPDVLNITLDRAIEQEPKLKQAAGSDPKIMNLFEMAKKLEGSIRHASTHAAGVVISSEPLTDYTPLYRGSRGEMVTQYAMEDIEKIGLVKFDFLGLRTLTVIYNAEQLVKQQAMGFSLSNLPMDDLATYTLLGTGQTVGLFQLESSGMRDLLMKMKPENFSDIVSILALYRPGPIGSGMLDDFIKRRQGRKKIEYEVPELAEILQETYGIIVYQEQVMKIANVLALFSLGEADILRRAMGKKKPEEMAKQKASFITRAVENKIPPIKAEKIFDQMEYFAGYGFNKSHSAAYALITYQTAYLKCHYPIEFMTALLSSEMGNQDKVVYILAECRRMGIRTLPPDVNESDKNFTIVADRSRGGDVGERRTIRFGLAAVKNVGSAAVDSILTTRKKEGSFRGLFDFCKKNDLRITNKRVIESLIKSGAFDTTGAKRSAMLSGMELVMQYAGQSARQTMQLSLFEAMNGESDSGPPLPDIPELEDAALSKLEKETVGFYITHHPLFGLEETIKKMATTAIVALEGMEDGREIRICGMVAQERVALTKRGDKMAYLQLEDLSGRVEVIIFPDVYKETAHLFKEEQPLIVQGILDHGEKGIKVKATGVARMPLLSKAPPASVVTGSYCLSLSPNSIGQERLVELKNILRDFPGTLPVLLKILTEDHLHPCVETLIAVDPALAVDGSPLLSEEIERRFGKGVVRPL